ncbi:MAG: FtsW/RodA/SpoVE family cell cycle protein [Byssovorax sp.]
MSWLSRSWSSPVLRAGALSLTPLAAGAFGVMVMAEHGATGAQRGLQIGALALGVVLASSLARLGRERLGAACPWAAGAAIAILGSTLASEGMSGARRWILLGPIRMHASSLTSPMILVGAALLLTRGRVAWASALLLAGQLVHALQPDAGQATALAVGGTVLLAAGARLTPARALVALALVGAAALTWSRLDALPAVPIVEGIVALAGAWGRSGQALAVALLAAIPLGLALVAYLTTTLLVPLFGNYPVPVMGFGASPILGVALCVGVVAID